jgi:hypothetical protein
LRDNILGSTLRPPSLLYDFITTSPAGFTVIKCRFVTTRRCRVQARPKNGRTEQEAEEGWGRR